VEQADQAAAAAGEEHLMPRFRFRLEDPNSNEFRIVVTHAASEEEARATVERMEAKYVAFRMDADELAETRSRAEAGSRAAAGRLHMHNQASPYRVASVREG